MLIVDKNRVPFILRGKVTRVTVPFNGRERCPYRKGQSHALNPRSPRVEHEDGTVTPARIGRALARVRVVDVATDEAAGAWLVTVELDRAAPPRFLHRRSEKGYTSHPADALPGEPEAVDEQTLEGYARSNRERFEALRDQASQNLVAELAAELARAEAAGVDPRYQRMAIQRRIRALKRMNDARTA